MKREFEFNAGIKQVADLEFDNVNGADAPDFVDAYICRASVLHEGVWQDATEDEIDEMNEDADFVYENLINWMY